MLKKRLIFSTASIFSVLLSVPLQSANAGSCAATSKKSELVYIGNEGDELQLKRNRSGTYKLDGDVFESGRRLRFFGKIKKTDPNDDFMVVIKIRGTSEEPNASNTKTVRLRRPSQGVKDHGFSANDFALDKYSKYHFPDENGRASNVILKYKFHTPYRVAGVFHQTDDSNEKKKLFQFDGVGNTWKGGIFSRIFQSFAPDEGVASTTTKYVYLQAEIQNLKSSPCFDFRTFVPKNVDDLLIQVIPIDAAQRDSLEPSGKQWPFKKEDH